MSASRCAARSGNVRDHVDEPRGRDAMRPGTGLVSIDGVAKLTRSNFAANGTIAIGDQTNDPDLDGVVWIKSLELLCPSSSGQPETNRGRAQARARRRYPLVVEAVDRVLAGGAHAGVRSPGEVFDAADYLRSLASHVDFDPSTLSQN